VLTAPSAERKELFIQNQSDTNVNITVDGDTPTTSTGLLIYANGGARWWTTPGTVPQIEVKCIHGGSGDKALYIEEKH
jgi:hypothetical protein